MDYQPLVSSEDTPITENLADERTARDWAAAADIKRPWRSKIRTLIADAINRLASPPVSVLELGCGPGILAEEILDSCEVSRYFASDYSEPMLAMSRERLACFPQAELLPLDFKREELLSKLPSRVDIAVAMQSTHEIRHKMHLTALYRQVNASLHHGGLFLLADHEPANQTPRAHALYATSAETASFLSAAGFEDVQQLANVKGIFVFTAKASAKTSRGSVDAP